MRRIDVIALALVALVAGSAAVTASPLLQDRKRVVTCANNLKQLWTMQANYMAQFGGRAKLMPPDTGEAFWLKLSKTTPPLIDDSITDIYQCPVENVKDEGCDYRGPVEDVNTYMDGDPVGADVDGNHGEGKGGNVIRKSGDCMPYAATDPMWKAAETRLKGGNKAIPPKDTPETAKQKQACVDLAHLAIAVMLYREFMGVAPKTLDDLLEKPKDAAFWPDGGFLPGGKLPKDPWGNAYQYKEGERRDPKVWSWGADGKEGGDGDNADLTLEDIFKGRSGDTPAGAAASSERNASATLKTIATAQADFRSNDRDNNLVNDFWVADVYSLYALCPLLIDGNALKPDPKPERSKAILLIEPSAAEADAAPTKVPGRLAAPDVPAAKAGYFFRAVEKDEEGKPYGEDTDGRGEKFRNRTKFAFCAYPADYGKGGKLTFLMTEDCTIWRKDTGGKPVTQTPAEPAKEGWSKLD
jgi:general secretion pathway protein G